MPSIQEFIPFKDPELKMTNDLKTVSEMIRTTAENQSTFLLKIAEYIQRLEIENANLKLEIKKWSVTLEHQNNDQ